MRNNQDAGRTDHLPDFSKKKRGRYFSASDTSGNSSGDAIFINISPCKTRNEEETIKLMIGAYLGDYTETAYKYLASSE